MMALLLLVLAVSASANDKTPPVDERPMPPFEFELSGVFTWGEVITNLCRGGWCRSQLPREFYEMKVPLSVYEHDFENAFKALSMQARADGYVLRKKGSRLPIHVYAELDEEKSLSYVSCVDTTVKTVPVRDYRKYVYADSLKCLSKGQKNRLDSLKSYNDSLVVPSSRYRVSFYVVSSSYVQSLGVDWTVIWARGDLVHLPSFITDWTLKAVADQDTSAEFRSVELDVDTMATLHWGSQRKEEKSIVTYSNGVSQQDYEWKNYGLTLSLSRSKKGGIRGEYTLAQRDENNSVLSGNFGGGDVDQDSIVAYGVYDSYQVKHVGVPFLSSVPLLGNLFGYETTDKVKSFFVIEIYKVLADTVFRSFRANEIYKEERKDFYEGRMPDSSYVESFAVYDKEDSLVTVY